MLKKPLAIGQRFSTKYGKATVINYESSRKVTIRFDTGNEKIVQRSHLEAGRVKNPMHPVVFNIGYLGIGKYTYTKHSRLSIMWRNMLQRCYDPRLSERYPTYKGCTVARRWHNFQKFCKDCERMPGYNNTTWQLDKDILQPGNKKYSRRRCVLVPSKLNNIFTIRRAASRRKIRSIIKQYESLDPRIAKSLA